MLANLSQCYALVCNFNGMLWDQWYEMCMLCSEKIKWKAYWYGMFWYGDKFVEKSLRIQKSSKHFEIKW